MKSTVIKRSVVINGHKTSVSVEDHFWAALKEIAAAVWTRRDGRSQPGRSRQPLIRAAAVRPRAILPTGRVGHIASWRAVRRKCRRAWSVIRQPGLW